MPRFSTLSLLAVPAVVICGFGLATIPSSASASCDVPPYQRSQLYPRSTAKLVGAPRTIRRSNEKLRVVWRDGRLQDPVIRWFRGCRTGRWWADEQPQPAKDGRRRYFSAFDSLHAPRGRLELWAEFTRYPEPGEDYESDTVMTHLGSVRMSRTIPRDRLAVDLSVWPPLSPDFEVRTSVSVTHQHRLVIRESLSARICDQTRCTSKPMAQRRTASPARRLQKTGDVIPYPRTDPPSRQNKLLETSYEPRHLPSTARKLDQAEFAEFCAAIRGGSSVQFQLSVTARQSDRRGKSRTARKTRTLDPSLCPPTA